MGQTQAQAWWVDVEHLRDAYDRTDEARRRADLADRRPPHAVRDAVQPRSVAPVELAERDRSAVERRPPAASRPAPAARRGPHPRGTAVPARRTIEIRGRTVPAPPVPRAEIDRTRPPRRAAIDRVGPRPDRLAMWALLMGLLLILVAVGTADASVLVH